MDALKEAVFKDLDNQKAQKESDQQAKPVEQNKPSEENKQQNSEQEKPKYDYDLFVIGGGSGGLSLSREAVKYNVTVGLADFVKPSPIGSTWGLGGTCVNVGCIPKKMMHYAAELYDSLKMFKFIGYKGELNPKEHDWSTLVENVHNHIASLNFGYRTKLRSEKVKYINKLATFKDNHTLELKDKKGKIETITADKIAIVVGGRPNYPDYPGAKELCVTSDDIFNLDHAPGKTLVIGASYIAVECACILQSLGYETHLMIRSIILRGFDRDMANRVEKCLKNIGIKFIEKSIPISFVKNEENNKIIVEYENTETKEKLKEEYDTVLLATGRKADTSKLGLENTDVKINNENGKIIIDENEKTTADNIYAFGDCGENRPELTPPAIMAGKLLARRLFNNSLIKMDYENIATTVYTSIEYGSVGLSEEKAIEKYGKDNIKIYHSEFTPVEWTINMDNEDTCYMKCIVNVKDNNKVVGFHVFAPNAGEITQGVSVAMKCGLTKDLLDSTVGIHPTIAEEMTTIDTDKSQGDGKKSGC